MSSRPLLTITQIVEQFNVSRATVRRGIEKGRFPGVSKDSAGRWVVPIDALISDGVKPRKTWLDELAHGDQKEVNPLQPLVAAERAHYENDRTPDLAHNTSRIAQLEAELSAERQLRMAAERNAEDLRTAIRMLESGRPQQGSRRGSKQRWWQRK